MQIKKIVTPIYVNDVEKALPFYEEQLQTKAGTRFKYEGLEIAVIGQLLLIGGPNEALAGVRKFALSFLVDDILAYKTWLLDHGANILQDITKVPTGYNMFVRQPDGTVFEYVEHTMNV